MVADNIAYLARKIVSETKARLISSELVTRSDNVTNDSVNTVNKKLKKFFQQDQLGTCPAPKHCVKRRA